MPSQVHKILTDLTQPAVAVVFHFPILEDPATQAFGLLLGHDATLVSMTVNVHIDAASSRLPSISYFGAGLTFDKSVHLDANLTFAYDTFGLRAVLHDLTHSKPDGTPYGASNIVADIAKGFYVSAASKLDIGGEIGIHAGYSLGLASFSVGGDVGTPNDGNDSVSITLPDDGTGKVRLDKFFGSLQATGELEATLNVSFAVGFTIAGEFIGYSHTFDLATVAFLTFNGPPPLPVLAVDEPNPVTYLPTGTLLLLVGAQEAQYRDVRYSDDTKVPNTNLTGGEDYSIAHVSSDASGETLDVTAFNVTQRVSGIKQIICNSDDTGNLIINVEDGVTSSVVLSGGAGSATLTYSGSGSANLTAGHGDSTLTGGSGSNTLTGLEGNDTLVGGTGEAEGFFPGAGNNLIVVQGGGGFIFGGGVQTGVHIGPKGYPVYTETPVNTVEVMAQPRTATQKYLDPGVPAPSGTVTTTLSTTNFFGPLLTVTVRRPDGSDPVDLLGSAVTDLILDSNGELSNTVNVDDVSTTGLTTLSIDLSHVIDYGNDQNKVTVQGSPGPDMLGTRGEFDAATQSPETGVTVTSIATASNPGTTSLAITIRGLGLPDLLTLDGAGGNNKYSIQPSIDGPIHTNVLDSGHVASATVDGSVLLPGTVAVDDLTPALRRR